MGARTAARFPKPAHVSVSCYMAYNEGEEEVHLFEVAHQARANPVNARISALATWLIF